MRKINASIGHAEYHRMDAAGKVSDRAGKERESEEHLILRIKRYPATISHNTSLQNGIGNIISEFTEYDRIIL